MGTKKVKKISDLEPIHFVELIKPSLFQQWLSAPKAKEIWHKVVETMYYDLNLISRQQRVELDKIPAQPQTAKNQNPELVGHVMMEYVEIVLGEWIEETTSYSTNLMISSLPLFVEMSKYLPHVNPRDEYQYAFRGTTIHEDLLKSFVQKNNKDTDWKKIKVDGIVCMSYVGPDKNKFVYKPHGPVQSWSVSAPSATNFGNHLIATKIDRSFFFEPAFLNKFDVVSGENETIHFGKESMKVALLMDVRDYKDYKQLTRWNQRLESTQTTDTVEVKDDAGTLIIPL